MDIVFSQPDPRHLNVVLKRYIEENSEYKLLKTRFPKLKDLLYGKELIITQIKKCIKKNPHLGINLTMSVIGVYEYLTCNLFEDTAANDHQRTLIERMLEKNNEEEVRVFYLKSKLRWNNIINLPRSVQPDYDVFLYGFKIGEKKNVKKYAQELFEKMSEQGKEDCMKYRSLDFPMKEKFEV